jgi:hypothetical protein
MLKINEKRLKQFKVYDMSKLVEEVCVNFEYEHVFPSLHIKVYKDIYPSEVSYYYELSHEFNFPHRVNQYLIDTYDFSSKEEAIEEALRFIHGEIVSAIGDGHKPTGSWFVVNESYR